MPHVPGFAPFNAALVYAAIPEEALKLAALAMLSPRRALFLAATGVACGFAAGENVLAAAYAGGSSAMLAARLLVAWPAHLSLAAVAAEVLTRTGLDIRGYLLAFLCVMPLHALFDTLFFMGWSQMGTAAVAAAFLIALAIWRYRAASGTILR